MGRWCNVFAAMETWILLLFLIGEIGLRHSSNICSYGSCYGDRRVDFLTPKCNGSRIAVQNLIVGSKKTAQNCPEAAHDPNFLPPSEEGCCYYNEEDCTQRYVAPYGEEISSHYLNCTGRESCMVNVAWTDRPANCGDEFMKRTNYMVMEYDCISDVIDICQDTVIKSPNVYLFNPGYPDTPLQPGHSGCRCAVETCNGNIDVTVLDMRLSMDRFNVCSQAIQLSDTGQTIDISCNLNTKFSVEKIYQSKDRYMELSLQNNASGPGGNFWIGFSNSNGDEDVIISCGTAQIAKTENLECTRTHPEENQDETDNGSDSTCSKRGDGPMALKQKEEKEKTDEDPDSSSSKDNTAIIAGVVGGVAAVAAAAGLAAGASRKFLKSRVSPDSPRQPILGFGGMGGAPSGVAPAGTSIA